SQTGAIAQPFAAALLKLQEIETVGDVRGLGLLWGVEFVKDRATKLPFAPNEKFSARVAAAALQRGVLTYPMQGSIDGRSGDHILLAPPACERDLLLDAVSRLADAIREAQAARS